MKAFVRVTDMGIEYFTHADVSIMLFEAGIPEKLFNMWISGSTCPIVNNIECYFAWDVEKFFALKGVSFEKVSFKVRELDEQTKEKEIIDEF